MILIPSIELAGGAVVWLRDGDSSTIEVVAEDPIPVVRELRHGGAVVLNVVDLDAALAQGDNDAVLSKLAAAGVPFQVGGGVRSAERAAALLELGADRVVVGTLLYTEPERGRELIERFGVRVVAALDVHGGHVRVGGRRQTLELGEAEALSALVDMGVGTLVHTVLDGAGADPAALEAALESGLQVFAQVGLQAESDLAALRELTERGLAGVIVTRSAPRANIEPAAALTLA